MKQTEKMLENVSGPEVSFSGHKADLKRGLLSSNYFNKQNKMNMIKKLFPKIAISGSLISVAMIAVLTMSIFRPMTTGRVLAKAEESYSEGAREQGRYYFSEQRVTVYFDGEEEEWTTQTWEDLETGSFKTKMINADGKVIDEYAIVDGKEYYCEKCWEEGVAFGGEIEDGGYSDELMEYITIEEFDTLSMAEIDKKLVDAGREPMFDKNDPLYNMNPEKIEELSEEEMEKLFEDYEFDLGDEEEHLGEEFEGIISLEEFNTLSMAEIDKKLVDAGEEPMFNQDDPLYNMNPEQIGKLSDEELNELYEGYGEDMVGEVEVVTEEEGALEAIWDLQNNSDKTSRAKLFSQLKESENVDYLGKLDWQGFSVEGIERIEDFGDMAFKSVFYFDTETYAFKGVEESEKVDDEYKLMSSTVIVSEEYSDDPIDFQIDHLTKGEEMMMEMIEMEE
jgi:hypothetical protein